MIEWLWCRLTDWYQFFTDSLGMDRYFFGTDTVFVWIPTFFQIGKETRYLMNFLHTKLLSSVMLKTIDGPRNNRSGLIKV